ncbi:MAG: 4-hydroxythreonine-4-phosphate dehydrogenase PdxA [Candidatus Puniceispirillaceae bacterium]
MAGGAPHRGAEAPVILTPGDPAGIGAEISLKAFAGGCRDFLLMEDPDRLAGLAEKLRLDIPLRPVDMPDTQGAADETALGVIPLSWPEPPVPGRADPRNAPVVIEAIARAAEWAQNGKAAGMVTNPVNKAVLTSAGFGHPGHTEFLASMSPSRPGAPVMMLAGDGIRVVPATVHIPLREVAGQLNTQALIDKGRILGHALRRYFGCEKPRIAVCGLNPHAGEDGQFGDEDQSIIAPAVTALCDEGFAVTGPHSADTLFHRRARETYDAVIGMYHDQVLIPLKTIDFDGGVNVTLGLDFIRTSPDHGTAYDIAGTGVARPDSLMAAVRLARHMALHDNDGG